jgi:asparagine synthase (glutamine-hydrolysing)
LRQTVGGEWWRGDRSQSFKQYKPGSHKRVAIELGLVAVLATQLWHHMFIDHNLADLPYDWSGPARAAASVASRQRPVTV